MLNIKKILLPVDFPVASLDVVHQAATLARHFHSEIVLLHVVTPLSHAAGVPEDKDKLAGWELAQGDHCRGPETAGLVSRAGA
jgi:nucleotide-binding universal stress UspA family protein